MKIPRVFSDGYPRFFRELAVIFISIVLAFLFDDYRENRNEMNQYKVVLTDFAKEVYEYVREVRRDTDSVRFDDQRQGRNYARVLDLLWLDTLISRRQATLNDFKYVLAKDLLSVELYGDYGPSVLAEEITVRYSEQVHHRFMMHTIRIYMNEMKDLERLREAIWEAHESLDELLEKTDPKYNFTREDSLVFYSNEFANRYNQVVLYRLSEFRYKRFIASTRLVRLLNNVKNECESLNIPIPEEALCVLGNSYFERYECEHGRPVNPDSVQYVEEIVARERATYRNDAGL